MNYKLHKINKRKDKENISNVLNTIGHRYTNVKVFMLKLVKEK